MDGNDIWFVPKNTAGKYRCAIQVTRQGTRHVFLRSGAGSLDHGDRDELGCLMNLADISYLLGGRFPLTFEEAVCFLDKQTALKRA